MIKSTNSSLATAVNSLLMLPETRHEFTKHDYLFCLFFILQSIIIIGFSSLHSLCPPPLHNALITHFCCLCCYNCMASREKIMSTRAGLTCYWQLQYIIYQANVLHNYLWPIRWNTVQKWEQVKGSKHKPISLFTHIYQ